MRGSGGSTPAAASNGSTPTRSSREDPTDRSCSSGPATRWRAVHLVAGRALPDRRPRSPAGSIGSTSTIPGRFGLVPPPDAWSSAVVGDRPGRRGATRPSIRPGLFAIDDGVSVALAGDAGPARSTRTRRGSDLTAGFGAGAVGDGLPADGDRARRDAHRRTPRSTTPSMRAAGAGWRSPRRQRSLGEASSDRTAGPPYRPVRGARLGRLAGRRLCHHR